MIDLILRPEFLIAAGIILVATVAALHVSGLGPWRRRSNRPNPEAEQGEAADKSTERPLPVERPSTTFADVAGLDHVVHELGEVREFLADPARFRALGADLPKGVLLCGLPGTGKTLLGRALAGEAGVPFHYVSAAGFVEEFVGRGAARIRDLFAEAKAHAPSIVFLDELDAVGRRRAGNSAGDREFDHTLNQLLVELDGFDGTSGVLILGASNRPELLDDALLRPGRFDRRVEVSPPDVAGREAILRLHAARRVVSPTVDWGGVARQTAGLTGADLATIVNEGALLAARRQQQWITPEDVDEAIARLLTGPRSGRLLDPEQKLLVAYHEAGHALLSLLLIGVTPPPRVSIVARTGILRRSPWLLREEGVLTKRELIAQLIVLLGGRAAELTVLSQPSTQAEDDLEEAAELARRMVERWAMAGDFELARRSDVASGLRGDHSVRRLLRQAEQAAGVILRDHHEELTLIARELDERETLTASEISALASLPPPDYDVAPLPVRSAAPGPQRWVAPAR